MCIIFFLSPQVDGKVNMNRAFNPSIKPKTGMCLYDNKLEHNPYICRLWQHTQRG